MQIVEKPVYVDREVIVEKPYEVERIVERIVEREVPVERIVEKIIEVPRTEVVEKVVTVEVT